MIQGELFVRNPDEHLFPYWRKQLNSWVKQVWTYRHYRHTTGWSMATQGFMFASMLFKSAQISKEDFRRWWKFNRRVRRYDLNFVGVAYGKGRNERNTTY